MFLAKEVVLVFEASILEMNSTILALQAGLMNHIVVDKYNIVLDFLFICGDVIQTQCARGRSHGFVY
jgi:hypothetical protein